MGVTLQWRPEPDDRDNRSVAVTVEFGRFHDRGIAYMIYTDRVGPGVLVLSESSVEGRYETYLHSLNDDGFTVLAPILSSARSPDDIPVMLRAASAHLTENWHPRLGVIAFGDAANYACALAHEVELDITVLFGAVGRVDPSRFNGVLAGHYGESDARSLDVLEEVAAAGLDASAWVYPGTPPAFADPSSEDYESEIATLAYRRTSELLHYHLS
jgi:hypothetical protein